MATTPKDDKDKAKDEQAKSQAQAKADDKPTEDKPNTDPQGAPTEDLSDLPPAERKKRQDEIDEAKRGADETAHDQAQKHNDSRSLVNSDAVNTGSAATYDQNYALTQIRNARAALRVGQSANAEAFLADLEDKLGGHAGNAAAPGQPGMP